MGEILLNDFSDGLGHPIVLEFQEFLECLTKIKKKWVYF